MTIDEEFKIIQPKYYRRFQCDPSKCYDTCCERWKIIIDKDTYQKYTNSENEIIKGIVKTGLSINETSTNNDDYAVINLNNELVCPFLNRDNLCEAFINMGESSLSKTCKSYPRAVVLANGEIERGLEMSCSVAAEIALLNKNGIEFENIKDAINLNDIYVVTPKTINSKQIEIAKEIRTVVIHILQNRKFKLSERIESIGYFLNKIVEDIDYSDPNYEEVLNNIKKEKAIINLDEFKAINGIGEIQYRKQFDHLNNILSMKFKEGDSIRFFSKRYIECLMQVLQAFGNVKDKDLEKHYKVSYEKYLKSYLDKKSYILENFLVNYIFIYGIELFELNNIWTSYMQLCVVYGLVKFNLIGLAIYNKGMNDELMLKLIQSLSKTIITDREYLESVIKYLEKEKLVKFPSLKILIAD